ncbi:MAG TPA: hypothetical protein VG714_04600 [Acidobacteriaceae bacterium]|nr:hypothetical protein [Acidobacteriaceae bacterium]
MASSAVAQTPTMLVLRAAPGKSADAAAPVPPLKKEDIAEIKIGGKPAEITGFDPLLKGPHTLQLMIVMDSMQMLGSTDKFADLKRFVDEMPSNVEIGVGWLLQSHVKVTQPPTTDRALVDKVLIPQTREEAGNPKNDNGNPFSCLRDLAAHWPNADATKLRAVLVFTDGIIRSNAQSQAGDQESPDVDGASQSLERAGIIPYPFYWMDPPPPVDPNRSEGGPLEGQQNFSQLVKYSGGYPLFEGMFSPGSIGPLLDRLYTVLQSEAVVTVTAKGSPGKFTRLDVKATSDDMKIVGPDSVMIGNVWKK